MNIFPNKIISAGINRLLAVIKIQNPIAYTPPSADKADTVLRVKYIITPALQINNPPYNPTCCIVSNYVIRFFMACFHKMSPVFKQAKR